MNHRFNPLEMRDKRRTQADRIAETLVDEDGTLDEASTEELATVESFLSTQAA